MPIEQVQTLTRIDDARGCSLGYQVMHHGTPHFIPNGSAALIPIITKKTPPKKEAAREETVDFSKLLFATYDDGECPHCDAYPNEKWIHCETTLGTRQLLVCRRCDKKFKPHYRQRLHPWDEKR